MKIISIVIPMFNEQNNISNCIKVLSEQDNQDFVAIFVDDGSTDKTVTVLKESLRSLKPNFLYEILEQNNSGAAAARKSGILKASTDYVMFLDCDDKMSNDMTSQFYKIHNTNYDLDILIPDMCIEDDKGNWKIFDFYTEDIVLYSNDCLKNSLNGWKVHGCITIKKDIIVKSYNEYHNFNTNNENYGNNDEIVTRLNFSNSNLILRSSAVYYYCYNSISTTKNINEKKYLSIHNAFILNSIYRNNKAVEKNIIEEIIAVLWSNTFYMIKNREDISNKNEWKKEIKNGTDKLEYAKNLKKLGFKKKLQLTALKINKVFLEII